MPQPTEVRRLPGQIPAAILERAFELARSGSFATVPAIREWLRYEGYVDVAEHLRSEAIQSELMAILTQRDDQAVRS